MTIHYKGDPPTEAGKYLVRCDGILAIAEWLPWSEWQQIGIDYDVWEYSSNQYEIEVIKKLDLEALASD